jgi:hypothetical protein
LPGNVGHQDATNKEEAGDKETEETFAGREEEGVTGETSKDQETMVFLPMHELPKLLDRNQPTNHKSTLCEQ